jgi:hypothetical protein
VLGARLAGDMCVRSVQPLLYLTLNTCVPRVLVLTLTLCTQLVPRILWYFMPGHQRPNHVRIWSPQLRLYSDDAEVFGAEPFASAFAECLTTARVHDNGAFILKKLLASKWNPDTNVWLIHSE